MNSSETCCIFFPVIIDTSFTVFKLIIVTGPGFLKKRFCIVLKNIFIFNWQIVTAYTYRCSVSLRNLKLTNKVMCFIMAVLLFHYMAMDIQCTILYSSSPLFYFTVHCLLLITLPSPKYPTLFRFHIIFLFIGFSFWWNVSPLFGQCLSLKLKYHSYHNMNAPRFCLLLDMGGFHTAPERWKPLEEHGETVQGEQWENYPCIVPS